MSEATVPCVSVGWDAGGKPERVTLTPPWDLTLQNFLDYNAELRRKQLLRCWTTLENWLDYQSSQSNLSLGETENG